MTCLVLDDEVISVDQLRLYIAKVPTLLLKASFTDPNEALRYLDSEKVDIIFLDIEMPNFAIGGLDFINLAGENQRYIFTTAYPEYALPSYNYDAVDFLHKPYTFERFTQAINRAKKLLGQVAREDKIEPSSCTYMRTEGKFQRVNFNELCWIESERNGVWVNTEFDQFYSTTPISEVEASLPPNQFIRIHKSFIIALNKVNIIDKDSVSMRRQGKLHDVPIGDTYRKEFLASVEIKRMKR